MDHFMYHGECYRESRIDVIIHYALIAIAVVGITTFELWASSASFTIAHGLKLFIEMILVSASTWMTATALRVSFGREKGLSKYRLVFFSALVLGLAAGLASANYGRVYFFFGAFFAGTIFLFLDTNVGANRLRFLFYAGYSTGFIPVMVAVLPLYQGIVTYALVACSGVAFYAFNLGQLGFTYWRKRTLTKS